MAVVPLPYPCIAKGCERDSYPRHAVCFRHLVIQISIVAGGGFAGVALFIWTVIRLSR
jgi:hypothetical protein